MVVDVQFFGLSLGPTSPDSVNHHRLSVNIEAHEVQSSVTLLKLVEHCSTPYYTIIRFSNRFSVEIPELVLDRVVPVVDT